MQAACPGVRLVVLPGDSELGAYGVSTHMCAMGYTGKTCGECQDTFYKLVSESESHHVLDRAHVAHTCL